MADYYSQQKKVILLAVLLSLVIHGIIITLLNELFQDKKVNQAKSRRPINVELVQIKPKKAIPLAKPKAKANVKNKLPTPKPKPKPDSSLPWEHACQEKQRMDKKLCNYNLELIRL